MISESHTTWSDSDMEQEGAATDHYDSCNHHTRHRCRCLSRSAKTFRSVSDATSTYHHGRVEDAVHESHSESGTTALNLSMRHLGPEASLPISACLQSQPLISVLDVSFNSLSETGGINLVLALISNRYVTSLDVSGNDFGSTKVPAYLMVLMSHNNILLKLNLSKNKFNNKDAYFIAGGIMENNYITQLNVSSNLIEEEGGAYLGRALAVNNSLVEVNMSDNCVRGNGAAQLGKSIVCNNVLTTVNLSFNGLGYHGALAIRQCLLNNTFLKNLDISNNRINWEGALVLAHGLEVNTTLETLIAGNNPLTTTGCMDLIDAIGSKTCNLKLLDLQNVNVVKEFRQAVRSIQETNEEFKVIHGLVVKSHDVLGLRRSRELHPMVKILNYLLERELRPVELLRMMDKTVSFKLTTDEFLERCQIMGIHIKSYERAELLEYILTSPVESRIKLPKNVISYKVMLDSIERFIEKERLHRIRERKMAQALTRYQKYLMNRPLPQVSVHSQVNAITQGLLDKLYDSRNKEKVVTPRLVDAVQKMQIKNQVYY